MADAAGAAAEAPALRRSSRAVAKVNYAQLEERADSPPPEAPPRKRAKRGGGGAAATQQAPADATAPHAPPPAHAAAAGPVAGAGAGAEADDELAGVHGRITLTRATGEEFCLSKAQLASLPYAELPNPHAKRSGAPMRLYKHCAVLELALRMHGGRAGLAAARAKRAKRAAAVAEGRAARVGDRRAELVAALGAQGLMLRGDSWLCDHYLKHGPTPEWSLQAVVRRMGQMKFLHERTQYRSILRSIRDDCREQGVRWDAEETADMAEREALPAGGYPAVWPWLAAAGGAAPAAPPPTAAP